MEWLLPLAFEGCGGITIESTRLQEILTDASNFTFLLVIIQNRIAWVKGGCRDQRSAPSSVVACRLTICRASAVM